MTVQEILDVVRQVFGQPLWRPTGPNKTWRAAIIQEGDLKLKVSIYSCNEQQTARFCLMEHDRKLGWLTLLTLTFCEADDSWSTEAGNCFRTEEGYGRHLQNLLQTNELARMLKVFGENSGTWRWMRTKRQNEHWWPRREAFDTLLRAFDPPPCPPDRTLS